MVLIHNKDLKILLINSPDEHFVRLGGPNQINFVQHVYAPPVGLLYLKSFLKQNSEFPVQLWNAQVPARPGLEQLEETVKNFAPDLAGITVSTANWYDALECARLVKRVRPGTHVVAGGVHMSVFPEETLMQPEIDSVVIGEGEYTLLEMAQRIAQGGPLDGAPGLWFKKEGGVVRNPPRPVEKNPDCFPFPDHSEIDPAQHRVSADRLSPAAVIITSRGCPFNCTFCCTVDKVFRKRTAQKIVEEMLVCKGLGYRAIDFYDDIFNVSKKQVLEVCDEIIRQKVGMPWICRCRVDPMDEEMVSRMRESGCERIHMGAESASMEILDRIKKHITPEQTRNAFRLAKKHGISTLGYFMIGFPGETREQAEATVRFAFELDPEFAAFHSLMPVPGSEIYEQAVKSDTFFGDYVREFARKPVADLVFRSWETALSESEQYRILRSANLRFYFRPSYILRSLKKLGSLEDFFAKAGMAVRILAARA
jgi:anaerobic magnesium-protoporphyrin IX monomethyl ester cyclase